MIERELLKQLGWTQEQIDLYESAHRLSPGAQLPELPAAESEPASAASASLSLDTDRPSSGHSLIAGANRAYLR